MNKELWDKEIEELEAFFASITIPKTPVKLNNHYANILDVPKFISVHLFYVKKYNGQKIFRPYLDRLIQLKNQLN